MSHHTLTPAYLTSARADWERVSRDPDATPAVIRAAEDALRDAIADAETESIPCDDVRTFTVPMDDGTVIIDHTETRVDLQIIIGNRVALALPLSFDEAERIGFTLARPFGLTTDDMWAVRDQTSEVLS